MNILPKKSWHVRNKDNVAKVRKDEAEAEAQRQKKEARALLAEQEARTEFLRKKARLSASGRDASSTDLVPLDSEEPSRHLNLFQELQESGNKEYEEEKRQEKVRWLSEEWEGFLISCKSCGPDGSNWTEHYETHCAISAEDKLKDCVQAGQLLFLASGGTRSKHGGLLA